MGNSPNAWNKTFIQSFESFFAPYLKKCVNESFVYCRVRRDIGHAILETQPTQYERIENIISTANIGFIIDKVESTSNRKLGRTESLSYYLVFTTQIGLVRISVKTPASAAANICIPGDNCIFVLPPCISVLKIL
jgi:hypothetical protein